MYTCNSVRTLAALCGTQRWNIARFSCGYAGVRSLVSLRAFAAAESASRLQKSPAKRQAVSVLKVLAEKPMPTSKACKLPRRRGRRSNDVRAARRRPSGRVCAAAARGRGHFSGTTERSAQQSTAAGSPKVERQPSNNGREVPPRRLMQRRPRRRPALSRTRPSGRRRRAD